jgi:hypothetical protein
MVGDDGLAGIIISASKAVDFFRSATDSRTDFNPRTGFTNAKRP